MQKETKPNLNETTLQTKTRYKPHEMNTDATCTSQITSVGVKSDWTEKNMSAAFLLAVPLGNSTTKSVCSDLTTVLSILNCTDCPIRCCKKFSKFVIVVPFKIFKINFCGLGTSSVESSDDGKYQSETQMEQNSQIDEYETLMQKETKPNLNETTLQTKTRYKPHEMNTDATCTSQITSVGNHEV
jgi:hypothetical protein